MIDWVQKSQKGHAITRNKDVALSINKSSTLADGSPSYQLVVRFYQDSYKKITDGEYISVGIDNDASRMYFRPSENINGFFLSGKKNVKSISRVIKPDHDIPPGGEKLGEYNLLKDAENHLYYIDIPKEATT